MSHFELANDNDFLSVMFNRDMTQGAWRVDVPEDAWDEEELLEDAAMVWAVGGKWNR